LGSECGACGEVVGWRVLCGEPLAHFGGVAFASVVEWAIVVRVDISFPRGFCVASEEEGFHCCKLEDGREGRQDAERRNFRVAGGRLSGDAFQCE